MGSLKHEIETPHRINPGGHGRHGKVCRTLAASHPATRAWGGKEAGPGRNACDAVTLLDAVYDWYLQNPPVTPAHNFCCLKCNHKLRAASTKTAVSREKRSRYLQSESTHTKKHVRVFGEYYVWRTQALTDAHFQGKPKCCIISIIVFQSSRKLIDES